MKLITIDGSGRFLHWVLPNRETPGEVVEVDDADALLLSQHPQTKCYDKINGEVVDIVHLFDFSKAVELKNSEVRNGFKLVTKGITNTYTEEETATFPTQLSEALAWQADNNAATPGIDHLVANRPSIDKATLVSRIIANSSTYIDIVFPAMGKKQDYEDQLYALKLQHEDPQQPDVTQADFDAIVVDFS